MTTWLGRLEQFFVPDDLLPDGSVDDRSRQRRYRRMVGVVGSAIVVTFLPSMPVNGVPPELWLLFATAVAATTVVIAGSLLAVPAGSRLALPAGGLSALAIFALYAIIGRYYYPQASLLLALIVAGHASIQGVRAALVVAACGGILLPLLSSSSGGWTAADTSFALVFLVGIAAIVWSQKRLQHRGIAAVRAGAAKYRELLERVPAVVYTAEFGPTGAWTFVSPRIEGLSGFPAERWTSDPGFWWSRIHPDDRDRVLADEMESSRYPAGQRTVVEYRIIDRQGRPLWLRDEAVVVASDDGSPAHWSGFLVDVTDRRVLEEQLQHQAFHDPLTGLANRALFVDRVDHALSRARRHADSLAVLFLDLDDFKMVNDGMGHEAGDELLVAVAGTLAERLRPMDTAARLGGDEFAILLEDLDDAASAGGVADRILEGLAHPIAIQGRQVVISASIGIARPTTGREGAAEILRNADSAMYAAKRRGKGRHETYAPAMHAAAVQRLELAEEIRRALELGEFAVHYQPAIRLADGEISGFEALVRWNHPRRGLVMPGEFIPAAEETGQILAIGRLVLEEACRQARAWQVAAGSPALTMSVNVSARQFRDPSLCPSVEVALKGAGLDAPSLVLEITESIAMEDSEASLQRLRELKALGVRLAIDDFGTGYSSLSYLRRLPIDVLKMDKSFVDGIVGGGEALELARVIVRMGHTLRLDTVAEGVEVAAQAAALRRMGCGLAQGFHFARPMVAADVATLLARAPGGLTAAG